MSDFVERDREVARQGYLGWANANTVRDKFVLDWNISRLRCLELELETLPNAILESLRPEFLRIFRSERPGLGTILHLLFQLGVEHSDTLNMSLRDLAEFLREVHLPSAVSRDGEPRQASAPSPVSAPNDVISDTARAVAYLYQRMANGGIPTDEETALIIGKSRSTIRRNKEYLAAKSKCEASLSREPQRGRKTASGDIETDD